MLIEYIQAALRRAHYELMEDGGAYGAIPGLQGVWASGATLESCREELEQVLQDWLMLSLARSMPIPPIDGIDLTIREVA